MEAESLHDTLREVRDKLDQNHAVRLHRAISWLRCAERYCDADEDIALIAAWIAFNACYAIDDQHVSHDARTDFNEFTRKLCEADAENRIGNLLWLKYSQFVRLLIDNQFVFAPFWSSVRTGDSDWEQKFQKNRQRALHALASNEISILLSIILDRLYVLRNQLLHGGATYQSYLNRDQVRDGKNLLLELLPVVIELMMKHKEIDWGNIHYPVIED